MPIGVNVTSEYAWCLGSNSLYAQGISFIAEHNGLRHLHNTNEEDVISIVGTPGVDLVSA